uniref:Solute carrier family 12 member 9 n=1 Tax=Strongyloides papillosus TaxID=174720 RepID=A0A0N5B3Q0_STREA
MIPSDDSRSTIVNIAERGTGSIFTEESHEMRRTSQTHFTSNAHISGKARGLSTFSGVFAPVAVSMFSALLFLRMGFCVGQLGFFYTCLELIVAYSIILLTVLSLCAVSSNGAIEGGGVYYMISRSLGPEFGGSIGILFFVANVFSCALYIAGFTEVLINNIEPLQGTSHKFLFCVLVSFIIFLLCLAGSKIFANSAMLALFITACSYLTFVISLFWYRDVEIKIPKENEYAYMIPSNISDPDSEKIIAFNQTLTGLFTSFNFHTLKNNLYTNFTYDYTTGKQTDLAFMFAIIFSGVTGLMSGANMSGELARPSVSIPRGTLQAVFTTLCIYILTSFLLCSTCTRHLLQNNYLVAVDISIVPSFIVMGIFCTTFFSSMSNLIGASRVLNRLAHDKLFGFILQPATIEMTSGNPVISVTISWICVMLVFTVGAMNKIARLTSIFFLLSYLGVNVACLALDLTSAPNFRPTFKFFSWHTCALGVISSGTMMLVVDAAMSALAVVMLMLLIMILHYQAPMGSWGSISQALIYHQVRKYLLLLDVRKEHVKFWRPQILLLASRPGSMCSLMDFVNDLKKSGLYVIGHVKNGSLERETGDREAIDPLQQVYPYWLSLVDYLKLKAFVEITLSTSVRYGVEQLIRLSGLGAMKPNTVVIGFHEKDPNELILQENQLLRELKFSKIDRAEVVEYFTTSQDATEKTRLDTSEYISILRDIASLNKNMCIARYFNRFDREISLRSSFKKYIDVWPSHLFKPDETNMRWDNSSLFVLQLACILSMSSKWKSTKVRVFICSNSLQDMQYQENQLKLLLEQLRIKAKSIVVPWDHVLSQISTSHAELRNISCFPSNYVNAINEMIQRNSSDTAVCFLNLPQIPDDSSYDEAYLNALAALTEGLPPVLLVHGMSSVISTAL